MDEAVPGVLFQSGRYVVVTISDHLVGTRVMDAYAVVNIQTSVSEYETRFLWDAMQWCKRCEILVEKYLTEAEVAIDWPDDDDEEGEDEEEPESDG